MWDSRVNEWNSVKMGPKRDVVGELEKAVRKQGMRFAATFHHSFNWWFFPTWNEEYDCSNPEYAGLYTRPHAEDERPDEEYLEKWKAKLVEVIDGYRPDLIWFDFGLGKIQEDYRKGILAYYYNKEGEWDRGVVVTYKGHDLPPGAGVVDLELGRMESLTYHEWITDTSVDDQGAWSHVRDAGYKSTERLVHNLVDRVSKNGHLLLNVGPRADGTIPEQAKERLLEMGKWLEVNGEAIYGTTPWLTHGEGPTKMEKGGAFNEGQEVRYTARDMRFTVKDDTLYAICLGLPGDQVSIESLKTLRESEIGSVRMLGVDRELEWSLGEEGLRIQTPDERPCEHAYVFKIVSSRRP
jgi:alpha-L-fucosidase